MESWRKWFQEKIRVASFDISCGQTSSLTARHTDVRPSEKVGSYLIERQHERLSVVEKPDSSPCPVPTLYIAAS